MICRTHQLSFRTSDRDICRFAKRSIFRRISGLHLVDHRLCIFGKVRVSRDNGWSKIIDLDCFIGLQCKSSRICLQGWLVISGTKRSWRMCRKLSISIRAKNQIYQQDKQRILLIHRNHTTWYSSICKMAKYCFARLFNFQSYLCSGPSYSFFTSIDFN